MDIQFNLVDKTLYYLGTSKYQNSLVSDRYSKYFSWTKDRDDLPTFYTHASFNEIRETKENNLIILESSAIIPFHNKWAVERHNSFKHIYTHNSDVLFHCKNAKWIPGGGCWIGTEFGGCEPEVYGKTKLCSFTSSDKVMCQLHKMRLESWKFLRSRAGHIDYFGSLSTGFVKPNEYLKDYMFSIIFENNIDDAYFTEKIINCFATGTIPVYMGARNIGDFFDANGIIQFTSLKQLLEICNDGITQEIYQSKIESVRKNFELAKNFYCIEDYMWENYMKELYEISDSCK